MAEPRKTSMLNQWNTTTTTLLLDRAKDRIRKDFADEEISNWPGSMRRTREINRNKFYGGVVIGTVVGVWYLLWVVILGQ